MELSNGLFSSESLNGLLQQKWRNGQGDASSTYLSNKRKRDDVGQENNGVHNGNTELRNSLFPEPSRKNSKLDIFAHLATSHSCVVSHPFNPFGTQLVRDCPCPDSHSENGKARSSTTYQVNLRHAAGVCMSL